MDVFREIQVRLLALAQLTLGSNEVEGERPVIREILIAFQVFFNPSGLPRLEAQFQIDVDQFY